MGRGRVLGDPQGRLGALGLVSGPAVNPVCSCLGPWPHRLEATGPETGHTGLLDQAVEPEPPKCGPGIQLPACPGAFCVQGSVDGACYGAGAPDPSPHRVHDRAAPPQSRGQH